MRKELLRNHRYPRQIVNTSARLLRLLSLLQARRGWTGPQLADRLDVTTRTVRKDVERLRSLGYPIKGTAGVAGGYTLGAGTSLPPLLLDDDEAVAVAVGLRTAAGGTVTGIEETSLQALTKLDQVLPSRLRHRVHALHSYTVAVPSRGPTVHPDVLTIVAGACRDHDQLRFDYRTHDGATSVRRVEPHRIVHTRGRWYLVAWDVDRGDWRTFRADRIAPRTPPGPRFTPRDLPDHGDVAAYVTSGVDSAFWRYTAIVQLHAPAAAVTDRLPTAVRVESIDDHTCVMHAGADTLEMLAHHIGLLGVDFNIIEPAELVDHVRTLAQRYHRAAGARSRNHHK
jgi:predicted DNA-binding transcriptional regulator YafY